ncbi:CHAT domain-containing protein [Zoogloea sp.]|uniref:CHAT domain-containing protein n=1 Tax=Zoogloea sp. TaxID=49181 RepID=UPI0026194B12|nr:CHAT domain-containing protein [Zoogloea sp.]
MSDICSVKLEFLRPGPAHNQLLSPLTPYVAVCGDDGSVTVNMPFEHRELLIRLKRLRYENGVDPARDEQRQAEVRGMGEAIGQVIGQVPALLSALSSAQSAGEPLVHLRLVLSPSELGMVPFEMAIAPNAFPGSGSALFLQPRSPITVTREVRRGSPLKLDWNRTPRILFAFASPPGYAEVPAQAHLNALRRAIEPWVEIVDKGQTETRVEKVKAILTVLPDASLEDIRQACADQEYTHVHILAHGTPFNDAGDRRFGVALCGTLDPTSADVVDGTRLAIALTARGSSGGTPSVPTFVSLATCDSGNIESVLTPGGSIAHELHMSGIPWVVASQFPLWMRASTMAAEILYKGVLAGEDPRRVLFDLRQRLRANAPGTHDWASIVAYATVPPDFADQVRAFLYKQTRGKAEVQFGRLDTLAKGDMTSPELGDEMAFCHRKIRELIDSWIREARASNDPVLASERLGMSGALEKRIAVSFEKQRRALADSKAGKARPDELQRLDDKIQEAYLSAQRFYRQALRKAPTNHWVITQYLALESVRNNRSAAPGNAWQAPLQPWWQAACQISRWSYEASDSSQSLDRIWAIGTLLELLTLGYVFVPGDWNGEENRHKARSLADEMVRLIGDNRFPLESTIRQFERYASVWRCEQWDEVVTEILATLKRQD